MPRRCKCACTRPHARVSSEWTKVAACAHRACVRAARLRAARLRAARLRAFVLLLLRQRANVKRVLSACRRSAIAPAPRDRHRPCWSRRRQPSPSHSPSHRHPSPLTPHPSPPAPPSPLTPHLSPLTAHPHPHPRQASVELFKEESELLRAKCEEKDKKLGELRAQLAGLKMRSAAAMEELRSSREKLALSGSADEIAEELEKRYRADKAHMHIHMYVGMCIYIYIYMCTGTALIRHGCG